ncbi:hypothetical protein MRB53_040074 [Persea americana]|nr:hypothetical protein MRB53_040074 [Persea americana]
MALTEITERNLSKTQRARKFDLLIDALLKGGVQQATLDVLLQNGDFAVSLWIQTKLTYPAGLEDTSNTPTSGLSPPGRTGGSYHDKDQSSLFSEIDESENVLDDEMSMSTVTQPLNPSLAKSSRQTLYSSNLLIQTTHRDLIAVLRGGILARVVLCLSESSKQRSKAALITFVSGAAEFLAWSKHSQYQLHQHISKKIEMGATRSIVIRGATKKGLTEEQIRLDMEHIHQLEIVEILFTNGDAYVHTNSVAGAMYARTCMLSRSAYRGCGLEYAEDTCNVPIPLLTTRERTTSSKEKKLTKKDSVLCNRFSMLALDNSD